MAGKVRELRALIYGAFASEAECARAMGWARQRLSRITNGRKEPDVTELNALSKALGTSVENLAQIFLRLSSPNEQQRGV